MRADIDSVLLTFVLLDLMNWTARWLRMEGPLTVKQAAGDYWAIVMDGMLLRNSVL
ncbi:hypothetical protein [Rhodococcus qingshengii]|uniref:hypothetical protein n=1 Tax=Rhodococcus qingshengii TaxID=334542 RepID=UPI0027A0F07D|nr:hypothetical protein PI247_30280 [Rhodococcus qingshengii]